MAAKKRILLLEDDLVFHSIMSEFLTECGFDVTGVYDGADAIPKVVAGDFDVVLCDVMMPKMPGDVFFSEVGRLRPSLCERFVFMSGHCAHPRVRRCVEGIHTSVLLAKPFQVGDLLKSLDDVQDRIGLDVAA